MLITTTQRLLQYVKGKDITLVPTMGALHAGHLSLVDIAKKHSKHVVVSIFVNPTQFNDKADLAKYPRTLESDIAKLPDDVAIYAPSVEEMYPTDFATNIQLNHPAKTVLCGAYRDGHFDGVATIVTKLLLQSQAKYAIFGQKDYQQLFLIKRLVEDINIDCNIIEAPIMREDDNLAMSSRNALLTQEERAVAPQIYQNLQRVKTGQISIAQAKDNLAEKGIKTQYFEERREDNLELGKGRLFFAGFLGKVRLIDNL